MKIRATSVAVVVRDRKKSAKWYRDMLGFELLANEKEHWTVIGHPKRGLQIHLCEYHDGKKGPTEEQADTGILLTVDGNFEKATGKLAKRGIEFEMPPKEMPWGWISKIRDPDGNVLWLVPEE